MERTRDGTVAHLRINRKETSDKIGNMSDIIRSQWAVNVVCELTVHGKGSSHQDHELQRHPRRCVASEVLCEAYRSGDKNLILCESGMPVDSHFYLGLPKIFLGTGITEEQNEQIKKMEIMDCKNCNNDGVHCTRICTDSSSWYGGSFDSIGK